VWGLDALLLRAQAGAVNRVTGEPMNREGPEAKLRTAALHWLQAQVVPGERVLEEVGLEHGRRRMDLARLSRSALHGYELKSYADTLTRLPRQAEAYSAACSTCTLLLAEQHLLPAASLVPRWWGLAVYGPGGLQVVRAAAPNPTPDPLSSARLLWRDEALELLRELGAQRGLVAGTRERMYRALVERMPVDVLRARVFSAMYQRPAWKLAG
jgi:hypothetical protein